MATAVVSLPGAAQATSTTCSTSTVCSEYINTYSGSSGGVAIHGEADSGIGVRGTSVSNTGFYGASGSGMLLAPGVEGESTRNTTIDTAGAFGLSYEFGTAKNAYGVIGYGAKYGVGGQTMTASSSASSLNAAVIGFDISASPTFNAAVVGDSDHGTGVLAEGNGAPTQGDYGTIPIGVYAVAEPAEGGATALGIEAESSSYAFEAQNTSAHTFADLANPSFLIDSGLSTSGGTYFQVTNGGDAFLSGTLTTAKGVYVRTAGASGAARIAYGSRAAAPEIEDAGEGNLVNGRAVVAIDAALADSIDMRRAYHVFITPEGDCKGLYVTQKTPGSFVVRELQGGRSTLAFDYRIVAKPRDENGERLALAPAPSRVAPAGMPRSGGAASAPQTPDERLKAKLGPAGYARALAALRQRLSEK